MTTFTITPKGPFSLEESATFGFGQRSAQDFRDVMRLAFGLDDFSGQAGVEVRQDAAGVHCTIVGSDAVDAISTQVARVLSLDHDATGFVAVGRRDPVIKRLQAAAPGLRPPLFYSPYEAAAWSVLSARQPEQVMRRVRQHLSDVHGKSFDVAGQQLAAFPLPEQLLAVRTFAGITEVKLERLHGVAQAALDGWLDPERIRGQEPATAMAELQRIKGIGPFYSALILIRASGVTDVLPPDEPRVREVARSLYALDASPTMEEFAKLAEPWRPWRTWCTVLMRAAGRRILGGAD
ncbi:MAG: DNA-3-methyladenine glycosylase [Candidatus Limnocylindrales bacterium]